MCCRGHIPESENLFRHCIYPLAFKKSIFAQEKLMKLYDQPDGSLLASVAWERYVPTASLVHAYGCRLALAMNEKKRSEGKLTSKNRHVYCGAYMVSAHAIRQLGGAVGLDQVASADVIHHIEKGEIAHVDLAIILSDRMNVEGTKTAILDRLWNAYFGPLDHACACDKDLADHPKSTLQQPPHGAYRDERSRLVRIWSTFRFHLCSWLLRKVVAESLD